MDKATKSTLIGCNFLFDKALTVKENTLTTTDTITEKKEPKLLTLKYRRNTKLYVPNAIK